jgi:hypothetical protein
MKIFFAECMILCFLQYSRFVRSAVARHSCDLDATGTSRIWSDFLSEDRTCSVRVLPNLHGKNKNEFLEGRMYCSCHASAFLKDNHVTQQSEQKL